MPITLSDLTGLANYLGLTPQTIFPLLLFGFIFYLLISGKLEELKERIVTIEHAITELQTVVVTKYKIQIQHIIVSKYGQAKSPIVLKDEFKPLIINTGLDKQIKQKKDKLLNWLKEQKPRTGLDAQDDISNFVISNEVIKYLDLTEYKQYLYQKGKTSEDANGVLAVYLFEILIPLLQLPEK